jgi:hypothetical protein
MKIHPGKLQLVVDEARTGHRFDHGLYGLAVICQPVREADEPGGVRGTVAVSTTDRAVRGAECPRAL